MTEIVVLAGLPDRASPAAVHTFGRIRVDAGGLVDHAVIPVPGRAASAGTSRQ